MSAVFDLDALEREGAADQFTVNIDGREVAFTDPQELDWRELTGIDQNDPSAFLERIVEPADVDHFFSARVPGWKLQILMKEYMAHYGLEEPGKSKSSSTTSKGTARKRR